MRADARRNRERIFAAARELVTEAGVDATMDDIARRAQLAVGTLYRHFPAKEDLVAAIVDDSVEQLAARSEAALAAAEAGAPAGPELARLFADIARRHSTDRALKAAAGRLDVEPAPGTAVGRAVDAVTALLDRARAQGSVREDVTFADLVLLLSTVPDAGTDAARRERWIEIVIAGLAPPPAP